MREPDGGKTAILAEAGGIPGAEPASRRGSQAWTEWLAPGIGTTLSEITLLAAARSAHQQVEIGENAHFGRIFRLDDRVMSTEADAWIQHELMVMPMAAALEEGLFGPEPACAELRRRLGDVLILPYLGNFIWWREPQLMANPYHGHHGGLAREELITAIGAIDAL